MKRIAILGSTGSIGTQTLQIARHLGDVSVVALAARTNIDLLEKQAHEFSPSLIAVYDKDQAKILQKRLPEIPVLGGMEGLEAVASIQEADLIISAIAGTLGLIPTVAAIRAAKRVGLANKETLVSGGALVMALVKKHGATLIPIDSEHQALFQCLRDEPISNVRRMILTASGGPFRTFTQEQLQNVTIDQALAHPNWRMGPKVTVDCSTLMNKGLEVIEAHWLFDAPMEKIEAVIHPQSLVHCLIEFIDNSILTQLNEPSMLVPIQHAITYPERQKGMLTPFDFTKHGKMEFLPPDLQKFPCLRLAYDAVKAGGSLACYMNAANEVLVQRFLDRQIRWFDLAPKLEQLMLCHSVVPIHSLEDVMAIDAQARVEASNF